MIAPDAPRPTSTRKGGAGAVRRTRVIVDVREFRSALPSLLHAKGMQLEPRTLEVGDYSETTSPAAAAVCAIPHP